MAEIVRRRAVTHADMLLLAQRTAQWLDERQWLPADAVVLLPYAQLMPLAKRAWVQAVGGQRSASLLPRFLTTQQWAVDVGHWQVEEPSAWNWSSDPAVAHGLARGLLTQAGLDLALDGQATATLVEQLLQAAQALLSRVQAMVVHDRQDWLVLMREQRVWGFQSLGWDPDAVDRAVAGTLEPALLRIALEWVGSSVLETDVLWDKRVRQSTPALVLWQGLQCEGLPQALVRHWGESGLLLEWPTQDACTSLVRRLNEPPDAGDRSRRWVANDAEQEAQWASACVIEHLNAGRTQVAVAALDRALARRMRVMLAMQGVTVHDETGWKLSTTHAASQLMAWLTASRHAASSTDVLDAARSASTFELGHLRRMEGLLARTRTVQWPSADFWQTLSDPPVDAAVSTAAARLQGWRQALQMQRSLSQWQHDLREVFAQNGLWAMLESDEAGLAVLDALGLSDPPQFEQTHPLVAAEKLSLSDFTTWVRATLEAGSFVPSRAADAQVEEVGVSLIPLSQVLGRCWDALVIPGCDEQHLPWCPQDLSPWTSIQREQLGLPDDNSRVAAQAAAWDQACRVAHLDVISRRHERGEEIAASPLLRWTQSQLRSAGLEWAQQTTDPMVRLTVTQGADSDTMPEPVWSPDKLAQGRLLTRLTPSAYEDLRACPYRFHARQLLRLREDDELSEELDKRDWGNWVHAVLRCFHESRQPGEPVQVQLDAAAQQVLQAMALDVASFLPFQAAWPQLRDGYVKWLAAYEAQGGRFGQAELSLKRVLGEASLSLEGRLDRMDVSGDDASPDYLLLDYKTESVSKSKERVKDPLEDTQLAFYGLLMEDSRSNSDTAGIQAAYLNLAEQGEVTRHDLPNVEEVSRLLLHGLTEDVQRLRGGEPLRALGDGPVCEYCEARGLCRRDFWRQT